MEIAQGDKEVFRALGEAGLLDPSDPLGGDRFSAYKLLIDRGASIADLLEYRTDLGLLAARVANGGLPTLTRSQLAARAGVSAALVDRLSLAAGLPHVGPNVPAANESDVVLFETFAAGAAVFGEEVALQLARVIGAATSRIADALVSAFIAVIGLHAVEADPSGLALVQANLDIAELFPGLMAAIGQLLRRHLINLSRPQSSTATAAAGYESQLLVVGFVDLVDSTGLASRLETSELGAALSEFEATASDTVVRHGGRVVKLIGDEIMFTTPDPEAGLSAAVDLVNAFGRHPRLPPVRAGLAYGSVLTMDGDCFGPVVNLAARIVGVASAGSVLIDDALRSRAQAALWASEPVGAQSFKGFDDPVLIFRLTPV